MRGYKTVATAAVIATALAGCATTTAQPPAPANPPPATATQQAGQPAQAAPVARVHAMQALIAKAGAKLTASGLNYQGIAYAGGAFPPPDAAAAEVHAYQDVTVYNAQPTAEDLATWAAGNPGYAMIQGDGWWMGVVAIAAQPFNPTPAVIAARTGGEQVTR